MNQNMDLNGDAVADVEDARLLDDENELHGVLQKVADLARASNLHVERIQPQAATTRAAYRVVPFQMVVSGNFRRITSLLTGLESQST